MTYNTPDWPASPPLSALTNRVHCMDALELLALLPDASVDMVLTDPPYYRVKAAAWDNQWPTPAAYLRWLGDHLSECKRVLKPNGSLYLFASPQMAARVEVLTGEYFNVLNHLVWRKEFARHNQASKEAIRGYFPQTERIIFAENANSDEVADDLAGFTQAELRLKRRIFGDPIREAMTALKVSTHALTEALGAYRDHNHGGAASNWISGYNIPTPEQYQKMREYFKSLGGDYLRREYEDLRREYEDLRREYEDLRREYEDLRRPFNARPDAPYTDVWDFETVGAYLGKHECEKPMALGRHIVQMSTRPDALVLDLFAGSGALLDAARHEGRRFIGVERDPYWCRRANARLELPVQQHFFELFEAVSS